MVPELNTLLQSITTHADVNYFVAGGFVQMFHFNEARIVVSGSALSDFQMSLL